MKYRCLVIDSFPSEILDFMKKHVHVDEIEHSTSEDLAAVIKEYDGVLMKALPKITPGVVKNMVKLKALSTISSGMDFLSSQKEEIEQRGIKILSSPGKNANAVAEFTLHLIISIMRESYNAMSDVKQGIWNRERYNTHHLSGKSVGIIGFGFIGQKIAQFLNSMDCKVMAFDPFVTKESMVQLKVHKVGLDELLNSSDVISVHMPLTDTTRNMISFEEFRKMKDGVYFVVTSRGGIVNESALLSALISGKVAYAACDVMEVEPCVSSPLYQLKNFIATPHYAGVSNENLYDIGFYAAKRLLSEGLKIPII